MHALRKEFMCNGGHPTFVVSKKKLQILAYEPQAPGVWFVYIFMTFIQVSRICRSDSSGADHCTYLTPSVSIANTLYLLNTAQNCEEKNVKELDYVCEWRYNSCAPACPVTCQHPEPINCPLKCVEGCHAHCPPGELSQNNTFCWRIWNNQRWRRKLFGGAIKLYSLVGVMCVGL